MAITVDPATFEVFIPQSDLSLVVGTLYDCDTNGIRLQLKEWEASEEGIIFPDTHVHFTEVSVAGVTYARSIEIVNGYNLTFENGAYSVRLQNSNNNYFDVENGILNQNTVQIISNNSAGLIQGSSLAGVAAAVWNRNLVDHTTSGTFGAFIQSLLTFVQWIGFRGGPGK